MIKDLILEPNPKMSIDDMSEFFKGITICYWDKIATGILYHSFYKWIFTDTEEVRLYETYDSAISALMNSGQANNFKILEFGEE